MEEDHTMLLTRDITERKRLELFEHFCSTLIEYIDIEKAISYLSTGEIEGLFNNDYSPLMDELLNLFEYYPGTASEDAMEKILQRALPKMIETELGARKVTIRW